MLRYHIQTYIAKRCDISTIRCCWGRRWREEIPYESYKNFQREVLNFHRDVAKVGRED